jgi:hypothetical protein
VVLTEQPQIEHQHRHEQAGPGRAAIRTPDRIAMAALVKMK